MRVPRGGRMSAEMAADPGEMSIEQQVCSVPSASMNRPASAILTRENLRRSPSDTLSGAEDCINVIAKIS